MEIWTKCVAIGRPMWIGALIVVDSSVWIGNLRDRDTLALRRFHRTDENQLLVGDLVLLEVLRGAKSDSEANALDRYLRSFELVSMLDIELAGKAAANYRKLRTLGITIRNTADIIIGTYCMEHGHTLLHDDRDFQPMVEHLGLRLA